MSIGLHVVLAWASAAAVALVGIESAFRVWRSQPPGTVTSRLMATALLLLAMTCAGGLALLVRGPGPRSPLHLMYGGFALVTIPVANALTARTRPRVRGASALGAALFTLLIIGRLVSTG